MSAALDLRVRITEGAGSPVLLLHGLGDGCDTFWDTGWADALGGHRLVAFDARGHGGSPRPHDPDAYDDDRRIDDALAVLDHARITRAHVLGYSMGAWTAMRLAERAPGRVLTLNIGGAHPYGQSLAQLRALLERGIDAFLATIERGRGTLPAAARTRLLANDPRALAAVIARDREPINTSRIRCPVIAWAGEHDPCGLLVTRFANEVRGRYIRVAGADHFAAFDPSIVVRAVSSSIADASSSLSSYANTWSLPDAST
jgi:pimeloyl-ACP methyl ester carboxylesterase